MKIQISWLLQKPTDLDLHCLQRQGISGFSRTRVKPCNVMPHPLQIFSQSDYLIKVVDTNSNTEWLTVQIQISWLLAKPRHIRVQQDKGLDNPFNILRDWGAFSETNTNSYFTVGIFDLSVCIMISVRF